LKQHGCRLQPFIAECVEDYRTASSDHHKCQMTDLERCIETARVYRDELFSCNPHPEERGVKLGISDQVAEEVLLYEELAVADSCDADGTGTNGGTSSLLADGRQQRIDRDR